MKILIAILIGIPTIALVVGFIQGLIQNIRDKEWGLIWFVFCLMSFGTGMMLLFIFYGQN